VDVVDIAGSTSRTSVEGDERRRTKEPHNRDPRKISAFVCLFLYERVLLVL
jgi:hypothetical protein